MTNRLDAALTAVDELVTAEAPADELVIAAKVKGLLVGYDAHWHNGEWCLQGEPEQLVRLPIVNPKTGRTSRTFRQAARFDGIVCGYGKTVLLEHKSTSDDIADPNAVYWRRLAIDSQVSRYMLQSWQLGERLDGALYDVIRKPAIRPKRLPKDDVTQIAALGTYCGFEVPGPIREGVRSGQITDEDHSLYAMRVARETIADPDRYFQRRMIPRLDDDVVEYAEELWTIADEIRRARINDHHYRNSAACIEYARPCEYLGICSGYDSWASENWQRAENVHDELPEIENGRDVLTHSRVKTFQTCRRKHHYRYNLGLRRVHEDEPEAIYLGRLLHHALAAWWQAPATERSSHERTAQSSAATGVAELATSG